MRELKMVFAQRSCIQESTYYRDTFELREGELLSRQEPDQLGI
jgi:hypothetical protein